MCSDEWSKSFPSAESKGSDEVYRLLEIKFTDEFPPN